jgi:ABC-2 type transport system permease protein
VTTYDVAVGIAARTLRDHARSAIGWGALFATVVYTSAWGYASAYPTALSRAGLQVTLGSNVGIAALFGKPADLGTLGGFTAWRANGVLMIVGLVWGLLLGARALRGEEEDGRWEPVLAGATSARRASAAVLGGIAAMLAIVWVIVAAGGVAAAHYSDGEFGLPGAMLLATTLLGPVALAAALSACCGQLVGTRRRAAAVAGALVAIALVLRMVVAVYPHWRWLRRVNPLCWYDQTAPLVHNDVSWLVSGWLLTAALAVTAAAIAGSRDLDAPLIRLKNKRGAGRPVGGALALNSRVSLTTSLGWLSAAAALAVVVGLLSGPVAQAAQRSAGMRRIFERMGTGNTQAQAFVGLTMVTMATLLALCAAALVNAVREEETSGRLAAELSTQLSRTAWLAGRTVAAVAMLLLQGLAIGLGLVVGAALGGTHISAGKLVSAGVNIVPVAAVALACGIAVVGIRPRMAAPTVYAVIALSFTVEMVGSLVQAPTWLLDVSLLHHLVLAPAVPIRISTDLVLIAIAMGLGAVGFVTFRTRDLVDA